MSKCRWCKDTGMVDLATTSQPCLDCVGGRASAWLAGNDTGSSSKTIHCVLSGVPSTSDLPSWSAPWDAPSWSAPLDAADFGRCARLIDLIPEWEPRIREVAAACGAWRPLAARWPELKALYDAGRTSELDEAIRATR